MRDGLKSRRNTMRDGDAHSGDEVTLDRVSEDAIIASDGPSMAPSNMSELPAPLPTPDGSLKKRVVRIEKTIAEQTAWLHNKFELDESDALLDSCSAALVRKIMLQGRLHIMSNHICFYARIFGNVTKEKWAFSSIHSVRKRRGGFVANSIKITFMNPETTPVIIASLNHRDRVLAIIASRLSVLSPSSPYRMGSIDYDSENHSDGIHHDPMHHHHHHHPHHHHHDERRSDRSNSSTPHLSMSDVPSRNSIDGHGHRSDDTTSEDIPHVRASTTTERIDSATSAALDKLRWYRHGDSMDMVCGKSYEKRTEQVRGSFDVPPVFVFNALFMSDWVATYLSVTDNFNVQVSEWYKDDGDGFMRRDVSFRRPLAYRIGPRETRVKETHRYSFTSDGGVRVELEGNNIDVPYGEYFRVESYFEMKPTNHGRETEFISSIAVHFTKSTMLRSKIEAGALTETKVAFAKLIEMGKARVAEVVPKSHVDAFLRKRQRQNLRPPSHTVRIDASMRQSVDVPTSNRVPSKDRFALQPPIAAATRPDSAPAAVSATAATAAAAAATPATATITAQSTVTASAMTSMSPKSSGVAQAPNPTIIQMQDAMSAQLIRIVAIAALLMVCVLLLLVVLSFRRMKHEFKVLQAIVQDIQATARAADTCHK